MAKVPNWTQQEVDFLTEHWSDLSKDKQFFKENLNRNHQAIIAKANNLGLRRQEQHWKSCDTFFLMKVYHDWTCPMEVISKVTGKPDYCIHSKAQRMGLKRQKRFFVNSNYFDVLDTWEKCYVLGLLSADGNNDQKNKRISINLQEGDKKLLEDVKKALNYTGELNYKKPSKSKLKVQPQWYLKFSDEYMCQKLTELGVTPRKSLTLNFCTEIPEKFLSAYILGLWDGDGCISFSKSTQQPIFSFIGSENIVRTIADTLSKYCDVEIPLVRKVYNNYTFSIGGTKKVKRLRDWLYKDATIYLQRKYDRMFSIKETWTPKREFKPCTLCENKMIAKGLCRKHYNIEYFKSYNKEDA